MASSIFFGRADLLGRRWFSKIWVMNFVALVFTLGLVCISSASEVPGKQFPEAGIEFSEKGKFDEKETRWKNVIISASRDWEVRSVESAYPDIKPLKKLNLVFENKSGMDGYTIDENTIGLDVAAWQKAYGDPGVDQIERIHRILQHEYSHLLMRRWQKIAKYPQETPYERALFDLYNEGIGLYFSLSDKWANKGGELTSEGLETFKARRSVLQAKLMRFKTVKTTVEDKALRTNMTQGSFKTRWGDVPIALWLMRETKRDPKKLSWFVKMGPAELVMRVLKE